MALATLFGCSDDRAPIRAPFATNVGRLHFDVPDNPVYSQALTERRDGHSDYIGFKLCPRRGRERVRPQGCEAIDALPVRDDIHVLIHAPLERRRFASVRERPATAEPSARPLQAFPQRIASGDDDYGSARFTIFNPHRPLTTERGWPLATCDARAGSSSRLCLVGFAVGDVFVEAIWHSDDNRPPDQRQTWRIAVAIDDKVRALLRQARLRGAQQSLDHARRA